MKNKLLVSAFAVGLALSFLTSCKPNTDVYAICDDVSKTTIADYFSGAAVDGKALKVSQYQFKKDGTVELTVMTMGDGVYKAPAVTKFSSWELGEYNNQNIGRYLNLVAAADGKLKVVNYIRASIADEENKLPLMSDRNNKVAELPVMQDSLVGHVWYANDTDFYKIDTMINVMKVDSLVYKHREGRKYVIDSVKYDTTYVPTKMKWPVGPSLIRVRQLELVRNAANNENTGKWHFVTKAYEYDKQRKQTQTLDSISEYDFHWYFSEFGSSSSFAVTAVQDNQKEEVFSLKYDIKIPSITLEKQELRKK